MKAHLQVIFTLDELAAYLKVGKRTIYRLAAHGEIPAFKVGGTWRLRQSEIDQCINDQTRAGAKKEVMRKREQQKSSEQPVSPGAHCPSQQAKGLSNSFSNFSGGMTWTSISRSWLPELVQERAARAADRLFPAGAAQ